MNKQQQYIYQFENDDELLTKFLTEKYGIISDPFVVWRRSLPEDQRKVVTPRVLQTMLMVFRDTMDLEKVSHILPNSFDKSGFVNFINNNLTFNVSQDLSLEQLPNKNFSLDEEHVKNFIFKKYGAVAEPFVHWREGLSDNSKALINARLVQNMIHLYKGNIPLKHIAGLLPETLDKKHFVNVVEDHLVTKKLKSAFLPNKVKAIREKLVIQTEQTNYKP